MKQILWGLFKKIVIADNCATYANLIFNNYTEYSGSALFLGAFFFTIQIYCDFSGYSSIAIGTARLFGFNLSKNFSFPYFSRNFAEVWRKWHISLTTWFRDYLFIPLVRSSKINTYTKIRNLFILFITIGLWHGANWTYVLWGVSQAILFIPTVLIKRKNKIIDIVAEGKYLPSLKDFFLMIKTFLLTILTMVIFRAKNINDAIEYLSGIFSFSLFTFPDNVFGRNGLITFLIVLVFMLIEWFGRENKYAIEKIGVKWYRPLRWCFYSFLIFTIGLFMKTDELPFIYFNF
jgi:alginate O-acetyltransferase complex protein AlgI